MDERQRGRQRECARACVHTCVRVRVRESGPAVGCPSCGCRFERWRRPLSSAAVLGTARRAARLPPGAGCDRPSRRPVHVPFGLRLSRSRTRLSLRQLRCHRESRFLGFCERVAETKELSLCFDLSRAL